ncbi:MAG: hypothetical protein ABIB98_03150 [bacterium]
MDLILELYKINRTVFTFREISMLFPDISYPNLRRRLNYYYTKGDIIKLRKGIYAKEKFDPCEFAGKVYTPSYISFETVLFNEGIIFQKPEAIIVASYLTRFIKSENVSIQYRKMKREVLYNMEDVIEKDGYFIASKERAFLDTVFLYKRYYFDNLRPLNWDRVFELSAIYGRKALDKMIKSYYKDLKNGI